MNMNRGNGGHAANIGTDDEESVVDHGWGGLGTWLIIFALTFALVGTTLIMYVVIGKHTLQNWNLGTPPTAPGFIRLL